MTLGFVFWHKVYAKCVLHYSLRIKSLIKVVSEKPLYNHLDQNILKILKIFYAMGIVFGL